jgi:hypothetical protein
MSQARTLTRWRAALIQVARRIHDLEQLRAVLAGELQVSS